MVDPRPLIAVVLWSGIGRIAALLLGESLASGQILGALVVFAGVWLAA